MADALVDVLDSNLATKADIRDVQADIQIVRSQVEALKVQTRADIEALRLTTKADIDGLRLETKADIESVKGAIAAAKVETVRWLVGAIGFQTLAVLGAVVALTGPSTERSPDELRRRVALEIEERGEVAVLDPDLRRGCDRRLGPERHAEAGLGQHVEVVGAVADRERIRGPRPSAPRRSISVARFSALPTIGSSTVPVRRPSATPSTLERCS